MKLFTVGRYRILRVSDIESLENLWLQWMSEQKEIDEDENMTDLGMEMQPRIWYTENVYVYKTFTGNGHYEFCPSETELYFEGLRNSFGKTAYFHVGKRNGQPWLFSKGEKVLLELIEFCTSAPNKRFWLFTEVDNISAPEETREPDHIVNGEVSTNVRIHCGVEEHMHQSYMYWHPVTRVHMKDRQ